MREMRPLLEVEALQPLDGRRTAITWLGQDWRVEGDNHGNHGGSDAGPDGFDLVAAALGQCLLTTLLARAQRDGVRIDSARAVVATKARLQGNAKAPYISDFEVDLHVTGDVDETARAALEAAARTMCGVRETLVQTPRIVERVHVGTE
jgi:uncharacterized OsmC-like protein